MPDNSFCLHSTKSHIIVFSASKRRTCCVCKKNQTSIDNKLKYIAFHFFPCRVLAKRSKPEDASYEPPHMVGNMVRYQEKVPEEISIFVSAAHRESTIPDKRVGTRSKFYPLPTFNVGYQVIFALFVGKNAIFSNTDCSDLWLGL